MKTENKRTRKQCTQSPPHIFGMLFFDMWICTQQFLFFFHLQLANYSRGRGGEGSKAPQPLPHLPISPFFRNLHSAPPFPPFNLWPKFSTPIFKKVGVQTVISRIEKLNLVKLSHSKKSEINISGFPSFQKYTASFCDWKCPKPKWFLNISRNQPVFEMKTWNTQ